MTAQLLLWQILSLPCWEANVVNQPLLIEIHIFLLSSETRLKPLNSFYQLKIFLKIKLFLFLLPKHPGELCGGETKETRGALVCEAHVEAPGAVLLPRGQGLPLSLLAFGARGQLRAQLQPLRPAGKTGIFGLLQPLGAAALSHCGFIKY